MAFYTAYLPPPDRSDPLAEAIVVKDGFSFPAFVLTGFWLLYKRMWAVFLVFALAYGGLIAAQSAFGLPSGVVGLGQLALGLILGFEGQALWGQKLMAKGWRFAAVVEAADQGAAERRFFERALAEGPAVAAAVHPAYAQPPAPARRHDSASGVIGVFPGVQGR